MIPLKITDSVFYTGVNDRTTFKFENLWPLPYGVSYNSYIVRGSDKIALIDTVEAAYIPKFLHKISDLLGGRKIDYLVVNHMEPDHSGGITEMLRVYPEMRIIGNRQTMGMLKGFYGIGEDKFIEIKDNDTISLGSLTLRFIMTPMVHWPETMMTYIEEEELIFSGDAFGCFGALNGGVVDREMDTALYIHEMYRYYSNIVGKYGKFVQKALEKTKGLALKYICSTHGPVWSEQIGEVVGIYDRLSRYEGESGVTLVYGSMYGHTEEIAEAIARRLCERGIKNIRVHNASKSEMSDMISDAFRYKGLIIGGPTYSMRLYPPIEAFLAALETREIQNRVIATFGSFTWATAACGKFNECLVRMKSEQVSSLDMKQAPDSKDIESAIELADAVADAL